MARLTDRPDMTLDVYRGRKTTIQQLGILEVRMCFVNKWKALATFKLFILYSNLISFQR